MSDAATVDLSNDLVVTSRQFRVQLTAEQFEQWCELHMELEREAASAHAKTLADSDARANARQEAANAAAQSRQNEHLAAAIERGDRALRIETAARLFATAGLTLGESHDAALRLLALDAKWVESTNTSK
jgi:hypothetical protein